jgi:S1-C subfamily serine protease
MNDSTILFLGVLILALLIALLTRQELESRRLAARQELESQRLAALVANLRDEVRYDIPPARRVTIEGSILAVLRSDGKKKAAAAGVAFFISATAALTVAHNLPNTSGSRRRPLQMVTCVRPSDGARFTFDVVALDADLDFAVLRLRVGAPSANFLTVSRSISVTAGEKGVFLVTCNIRMAAEAPDVSSVGVAWHHARVVRFHPHNFLFDSPAFDGDSGGAIVVARTGEVIGLHRELVNAARELLEQKASADVRLNRVEASVRSLIRGSSSGCVGVRLDSDIARSLLDEAA